jgi:hypothetical protein
METYLQASSVWISGEVAERLKAPLSKSGIL